MSAIDNFFSGMTELINKYRESAGESADKVVADTPETKEEVKEVKPVETKQPEVNPLEVENKRLTDLVAQYSATITQKDEQINALKELTSVNNPVNDELDIFKIIQEKGEL